MELRSSILVQERTFPAISGRLVARARAFGVHEAAIRILTGSEERLAVRGATNLAIVSALMLAATPTVGDRLFTTRTRHLAAFAASLAEPLRTHVAALVDAALDADAATRLAGDAPTPDRGFAGWIASAMVEAAALPATDADARMVWAMPDDPLARYAAQAWADNPDHVLLSAIETVRGLISAPPEGERAEAGWDAVERGALTLCARAAASRAERDDARRVVVILWSALRRRRPLAAAVLRAKLARDRRRWATTGGRT